MTEIKKGRPSQEPRIAAAEARIKALEQQLEAQGYEINILKRQVAGMNDAFSNGNIPRPQYESQFKIWPGANPITNNAA
jgi:hypothetical protein